MTEFARATKRYFEVLQTFNDAKETKEDQANKLQQIVNECSKKLALGIEKQAKADQEVIEANKKLEAAFKELYEARQSDEENSERYGEIYPMPCNRFQYKSE